MFLFQLNCDFTFCVAELTIEPIGYTQYSVAIIFPRNSFCHIIIYFYFLCML